MLVLLLHYFYSVCILHPVCKLSPRFFTLSLYFTPSLLSAFYTERIFSRYFMARYRFVYCHEHRLSERIPERIYSEKSYRYTLSNEIQNQTLFSLHSRSLDLSRFSLFEKLRKLGDSSKTEKFTNLQNQKKN